MLGGFGWTSACRPCVLWALLAVFSSTARAKIDPLVELVGPPVDVEESVVKALIARESINALRWLVALAPAAQVLDLESLRAQFKNLRVLAEGFSATHGNLRHAAYVSLPKTLIQPLGEQLAAIGAGVSAVDKGSIPMLARGEDAEGHPVAAVFSVKAADLFGEGQADYRGKPVGEHGPFGDLMLAWLGLRKDAELVATRAVSAWQKAKLLDAGRVDQIRRGRLRCHLQQRTVTQKRAPEADPLDCMSSSALAADLQQRPLWRSSLAQQIRNRPAVRQRVLQFVLRQAERHRQRE